MLMFIQGVFSRLAASEAKKATGADPVGSWLAEPLVFANNAPVCAITFWAQRAREKPPHPLAYMAMDVLSVPGKIILFHLLNFIATSTSVERMFSFAGRQDAPLRNRLAARTTEQLTTVGLWSREGQLPGIAARPPPPPREDSD